MERIDVIGIIFFGTLFLVLPGLILYPMFSRKKYKRHPMEVTITAENIALKDERDELLDKRIRWEDIKKIVVATTAEGPWRDDIYYLFYAEKELLLIIPSEARGVKEMVDKLLALSGFDQENFIKAMGCTLDHRFVCWEKDHSVIARVA